MILVVHLTQPYNQKIILLSNNQHPTLHKKVHLQYMYKQTLHLIQIVQRLYLFMILLFSNTSITFKSSSSLMTTHLTYRHSNNNSLKTRFSELFILGSFIITNLNL